MSITESRYKHETLYKGLSGQYTESDSLPPQAIPKSRKGKKWKESNMDRLEEIGMRQIRKNFIFNDFYAMVEGDLSYIDYGETPDLLEKVQATTEKLGLPHYIQHYDLIGRVANYLASKYNDIKEKYRVDFLDPISENEYDREINNRVFNFAVQYFQLELQAQLLKNGLYPDEEFETEEEQQQYLQYLEQEQQKLHTPPEIKNAMDTEWRPAIVNWVEKTLKRDNEEYRSNSTTNKYFLDKFLTGRYFEHYNISYDYYEIERWDPRETFFSEDSNIQYPQDAEYVGNIQDMSPSRVVDMFGHLMTRAQIESILNHYKYEKTGGKSTSFEDVIVDMEGEEELIPTKNYYDRKSALELQSAIGAPLQDTTYIGSDGEEKTVPSFIQDYDFNTGITSTKISKHLRRDITGRDDTLRVTRAYWRSWERVAHLYYESEMGFPIYEVVTEDLLNEYIKENNIKRLNSYSLHTFLDKMELGTLEPNSIVFSYVPKIYKGIKISADNNILKKDIYLDIRETDFQIKGRSNVYRVQIPVGGIISKSEAKKMLPYQRQHNVQMNLIRSLTEKELGIIWMFDINLLPSDWEGLGDSRDILSNVLDMGRDIGLIPMDTSRQNIQGRSPQAPGMQPININYSQEISQKVELAEYYKNLSLEQIGLNPQSLQQPSEFSTAEGIKQGQVNSFAQIEHIYDEMDMAMLRSMEININVFQYCQTHGKDRQMSYIESDTGRIVREVVSQDPDFDLRSFGLIPMMDSKRRKEFETFKQYILQTNTLQNDLLDFAKILTSDSFQVAKSVLLESQRKELDRVESERAHEMEMQQARTEKEAQDKEENRQYELYKQERELETRREVARIQKGDSSGRPVQDPNKDRRRMEEIYLKNATDNRRLDIQEENNKASKSLEERRIELQERQMEERSKQNEIRREENATKRFTSIINKN